LLIGILVSLGGWGLAIAIEKYGLGFLTRSVWDPVQNEYGGLVMIYGTLATSAHCLADCGAGEFGIALFLDRTLARLAQAPPGHSH
jgi:phosphate transport system permease protein